MIMARERKKIVGIKESKHAKEYNVQFVGHYIVPVD